MLILKMNEVIPADQNDTNMASSYLPDVNLSEYSCSIPDAACLYGLLLAILYLPQHLVRAVQQLSVIVAPPSIVQPGRAAALSVSGRQDPVGQLQSHISLYNGPLCPSIFLGNKAASPGGLIGRSVLRGVKGCEQNDNMTASLRIPGMERVSRRKPAPPGLVRVSNGWKAYSENMAQIVYRVGCATDPGHSRDSPSCYSGPCPWSHDHAG